MQAQALTSHEIVDEVLNDVDVQYHWSALSGEIDDEKASQMLLKEIVQLWLNIRGFSEVGAFMERYKASSDKATKKSVGIRKDLKRIEIMN